jgi:hypothetical protein
MMRLKWVKILAGLALFGVGLSLFYRHWDGRGTPPQDFMVFHRAGIEAAQGGEIYRPQDPLPFKNAPGALEIFRLLPDEPVTAWLLFKALSIAVALSALFPLFGFERRRDLALLGLGFLLSWRGIIETLDFGQLELFGMGGILWAAFAQAKGRAFSVGVALAFLPLFKPAWALLWLYFWFRAGPRRARLTLGLGGGSIVGWGLLPLLMEGPERAFALTRAWVAQLGAQPVALFSGADVFNQNLFIACTRWFGPSGGWVAGVVFVLVGGWALYLRRGRPWYEQIGPALIFMQLLNPLAWRWGSVFLIALPPALAREKVTGATVLSWGICALLALAFGATKSDTWWAAYWMTLFFGALLTPLPEHPLFRTPNRSRSMPR